ncbi:co-chaperone GroES [bacterium]|nr:co-chaperone GroES [bacterium]
MSIPLVPLGDRVIVQKNDELPATKSGIVIADTAKERPQTGTVVAVGPGRRGDDGKIQPIPVKAGETVIFSKFGGTEFPYEGEDYLILREDDILAKVG